MFISYVWHGIFVKSALRANDPSCDNNYLGISLQYEEKEPAAILISVLPLRDKATISVGIEPHQAKVGAILQFQLPFMKKI